MRAKKALRWECSAGELTEDRPDVADTYSRIGSEPSSDGLVLSADVEEGVQGYECEECTEVHEGEPERKDGFVCGECEEFYEDREDAKECCR